MSYIKNKVLKVQEFTGNGTWTRPAGGCPGGVGGRGGSWDGGTSIGASSGQPCCGFRGGYVYNNFLGFYKGSANGGGGGGSSAFAVGGSGGVNNSSILATAGTKGSGGGGGGGGAGTSTSTAAAGAAGGAGWCLVTWWE